MITLLILLIILAFQAFGDIVQALPVPAKTLFSNTLKTPPVTWLVREDFAALVNSHH